MYSRIFVYLVKLFFFLSCKSEARINDVTEARILIDHDGGADDSLAIFTALLYEEKFNGPKVIGLTTTHGNVNEDQVYVNSQRILGVANRRDVPIYRGCSEPLIGGSVSDFYFGNDGLGDHENVEYQSIAAEKEHAVFRIIELSKLYPGNLEIIAIGPLTNIAMAVKIDPFFLSRLSRLVIGAGYIYSDDYKEPEFNVDMDVEAYHIVTRSASPDIVTILPFSQVRTWLNISNEWRKQTLGSINTDIMKAQNSYERKSLSKSRCWSTLDPAVVAIALDETIAEETVFSNNSVVLCGSNRGVVLNDFGSEPNVKLWYRLNMQKYKQFLLRVFSVE
ncbi:uncharacterized protein LOC101746887 isoform X2 [Bombyx mori]|uniref:Inosine/uridine-preferring nucleoside hydrolase domain-containing protein n=1 Tax=Bombyx mori TaxID=7091 RepID=A0A8R2AIL6_BOMMO|nr:probable uridine nucleosidase 2 isoform X2 [Bombyx mori]